MLYLILLGVTFLIQLLAASWYTLADSKGMDNTFKYKILCCSIYIADLLLCTAMSDSFTKPFFMLLLAGMLAAYTGDVAQSTVKKKAEEKHLVSRILSLTILSASSFYAAHILFGLSILISKASLVILCILIVLASVTMIIDKSFRSRKAIILLACILFLFPALSTGAICQKTGQPDMQTLSFLLSVGSLFIVVSDVIHAGKYTKSKKLLRNNLYLFGNMIFVCTISYI